MARSKKITDKLLDFWVKNEYNVLFEGRHGVGKTAMIKEAFERNGLKWKYYSAATMDPWCDFVGIPRVVEDNGNRSLEYVLPKDLNDDTVEALFFDEFNRSHKKIRNAVMELIQFKSINGRKFKNLKVVWAAINPHDESEDDYDVEKLDLALRDRFHVHVQVPFEPSITFFRNTFGDPGRFAVNWWKTLPEKVRSEVSPRRLEYAMKIHEHGGDVSYAFPDAVNIPHFEETLRSGDIDTVLRDLVSANDEAEVKKWLGQSNNVFRLVSFIQTMNKSNRVPTTQLFDTFIPLMTDMDVASLITKSKPTLTFVLENEIKHGTKFTPLLDSVVNANKRSSIARQITKFRKKVANQTATLTTLAGFSDDDYLRYTTQYIATATRWSKDFNRRSTSAIRMSSLMTAVNAVEERAVMYFLDVQRRAEFHIMFKSYLSRTNRATFRGPKTVAMNTRLKLFEDIVSMFNVYYPQSERRAIILPTELTTLGKQYELKP